MIAVKQRNKNNKSIIQYVLPVRTMMNFQSQFLLCSQLLTIPISNSRISYINVYPFEKGISPYKQTENIHSFVYFSSYLFVCSRLQNMAERARILDVCHVKLVWWHMIPAHLINKKEQIVVAIRHVRREPICNRHSKIPIQVSITHSFRLIVKNTKMR